MTGKIAALLLAILLLSLIGCSSDDKLTEKTAWPDGTVKEEWAFRRLSDSLSVREGKFAAYYESGNKHETGSYLNDRKTGLWTIHYDSPDSPRLMEGSFVEGEMDGIWTFWMNPSHQHHMVHSPDSSADSADTSHMMQMPDSGATEPPYTKQAAYRRGKAHGAWISWHPNRQVADSMGYVDGRLEGLNVSYYENGQKLSLGNYSGGILVGDRSFWNEDGSPIDQSVK